MAVSFSVRPNFAALGVHQHLRARPEGVGTDGEDGVLARLVLAQLRADAREQHGEAERLGDIVVGARFEPQDRVGIRVVTGQHDDRGLEAVLAQDAHGLAPVHVGQPHVHDDEVDMAVLGRLHALGAGLDRHRLELLVQASCSTRAADNSASSSTIRILRALGIGLPPETRRRTAALRAVEHSRKKRASAERVFDGDWSTAKRPESRMSGM